MENGKNNIENKDKLTKKSADQSTSLLVVVADNNKKIDNQIVVDIQNATECTQPIIANANQIIENVSMHEDLSNASNKDDDQPVPLTNFPNAPAGYANYIGANSFVPPPVQANQPTGRINHKQENFTFNASLSEQEARNCLIQYADRHCFYSKSAAKNVKIHNIFETTAFHYVLRSFVETRTTDWKSEPFAGGFVDGPENGRPPEPWQVVVEVPAAFQDVAFNMDVAHTSTVRQCHACFGRGMKRCHHCFGRGSSLCYYCDGRGVEYKTRMDDNGRSHRYKERCYSCYGTGMRKCYKCHGNGVITCKTCKGFGQIRCYVQLTVTFVTRMNEYVLEHTKMPDKLITTVTAPTIFEDTQFRVQPLRTFPDQRINLNSNQLIYEHKALERTSKIWMQNHLLRGVPVFQCDYSWKSKSGSFFVYGNERMVYIEDYPQKCCIANCTIL